MKGLHRLLALLAAIIMIIGMCACSQPSGPSGDKPDPEPPDIEDNMEVQGAPDPEQNPEDDGQSSEQDEDEFNEQDAGESSEQDEGEVGDQPEYDPEKEGNVEAMVETKLFYLGHASVRIDTAEGKVIYIDPYAGEDYGVPADLVLVTHYHGDHYAMGMITMNEGCRVIEPVDALKNGKYQSFEESGVKITAVPAYNSNHKKSECVGYVLEFDGIKLYHAGDTSKIQEMADLAAESLDYALLPMDDVYNMGPAEAEECADMIGAKHYIPIHTGPNGVFSEENIAKFNPEGKIVVKPGETLTLSPGK